MSLACCAADGRPVRVLVAGTADPAPVYARPTALDRPGQPYRARVAHTANLPQVPRCTVAARSTGRSGPGKGHWVGRALRTRVASRDRARVWARVRRDRARARVRASAPTVCAVPRVRSSPTCSRVPAGAHPRGRRRTPHVRPQCCSGDPCGPALALSQNHSSVATSKTSRPSPCLGGPPHHRSRDQPAVAGARRHRAAEPQAPLPHRDGDCCARPRRQHDRLDGRPRALRTAPCSSTPSTRPSGTATCTDSTCVDDAVTCSAPS